MKLIKCKGSWLSLLLVLSLGSFICLTAMEKGNESSSDDEATQEKRKWTEEEERQGDEFIDAILATREDNSEHRLDRVKELLKENPTLVNYQTPFVRSPITQLPEAVTGRIPSNAGGDTPLHLAIQGLDDNLTELLLAYEADPRVPNYDGYPPIFYAIELYNIRRYEPGRLIKLLASNPTALTARGPFGQTPLQFAVTHGYDDAANLLLNLGVDVNGTDNRGWTALHYAVRRGELDAIKSLLARGADPRARTNDSDGNRTPDMIAASSPNAYSPDAAQLVINAQGVVNRILGFLGSFGGWRS